MTPAPLAALLLAAAPPAIGYVQATGWAERATQPARYQPARLVDGDARTAWCASGAPGEDAVSIGFAAPVAIDEVRIATGNQADASAFHGYARPRKFVLRTDGRASTFAVADTEGTQTVKLDGPVQGTEFTLEVLDVEPAEDPAMPPCISELQLVSHGRVLPAPPKRALRWSPERAALIGTWWAGDENAPDRALAFFADGTWQSRITTYAVSGPRVRTVDGAWGLDGKDVWMKAPTSARGRVKVLRETQTDARGKARTTLALSGGVPAELRVPFRDRR